MQLKYFIFIPGLILSGHLAWARMLALEFNTHTYTIGRWNVTRAWRRSDGLSAINAARAHFTNATYVLRKGRGNGSHATLLQRHQQEKKSVAGVF